MRKTRGTLVAGLALALVVSSGAWGYVAMRDDDRDAVQKTASNEPGLLDRLGGAARGLVGSGGKTKAEVVPAGLAVSEQPAAPKKWPAQKRVREVASKRTAHGKVYQLSDGRLQAEISAVPVNYRDRDGKYRPIDTTVRATGRPGYVQANTTYALTSLFGDPNHNRVHDANDLREK
jgi:hypothetical protein